MKYALPALLLLATALSANATQIQIADFSGSETVTTFDGLGLAFQTTGSLVLDGNTYTTDSGVIRYSTFQACTTNECIGNNSDLGYIDVVLGSLATRAGATVGILQSWTGQVEFFDAANALIGTINVPTRSGTIFAGWEHAAGISRYRLTDLTANSSVINLENFRFEGSVPEPSTMLLLGAALAGLRCVRRTRRDSPRTA
jgi:hypothetical protein